MDPNSLKEQIESHEKLFSIGKMNPEINEFNE